MTLPLKYGTLQGAKKSARYLVMFLKLFTIRSLSIQVKLVMIWLHNFDPMLRRFFCIAVRAHFCDALTCQMTLCLPLLLAALIIVMTCFQQQFTMKWKICSKISLAIALQFCYQHCLMYQLICAWGDLRIVPYVTWTQAGHGWDVKSVDWHPTKSLLVSGICFFLLFFLEMFGLGFFYGWNVPSS